MAAGDLKKYQIAAVENAKEIKRLYHKAQQLKGYYDALDLGDDAKGLPEDVEAPLTKNDMTLHINMMNDLISFVEGGTPPSVNRANTIERVATVPFVS